MSAEPLQIERAPALHSTDADEINREHRLARESAESAVQHAIRCGELLAEKKGQLPHGEFQSWIEANCEFSYQSANIYMKAATNKSNALDFSSLRKLLASGKRGTTVETEHATSSPDTQDDSKTPRNVPRAVRVQQISELAAQGCTSRQIAKAIGFKSARAHERVMVIAKQHAVTIPDVIIGRVSRIHAKRVIEQTVNGLVGYAHGLETIGNKWDDVTKEDAAAWIDDLGRSLRTINRLMKSLREFSK